MAARHDVRDLDSMISHLRHDLIKHLDIPQPNAPLTRAGWEVLLRRLYSDPTGLVPMGRTWAQRLRQAWRSDDPAVALALDALVSAVRDVGGMEAEVLSKAHDRAATPDGLVEALMRCVGAVRLIEQLGQVGEEAPAGGEDEGAAFDWLLEDAAPVKPKPKPKPKPRSKRAKPRVEPTEDVSTSPCRVLVVDDRLMAIERFHVMPQTKERFEWVTLCELDGPCWTCPHRNDCGLKRARMFRELEGTLRRAQASAKPIDVLLMDVRFDDLAAGELLPMPAGIDLEGEEAARALQGPLMVHRLRRRADLPNVPVVLMTARRALPAGAELLLEGLDGLHFVDDEASIEALTARLDSVARRRHRPMIHGAFFWGRSSAMLNVREQVELLALGPRPVLLTGPSGTGKSFLVEEVLLALSRRNHLVTIDLSAVPETLVESELFGHVKGAFSGATTDRPGLVEEADGGILFIDEIGHLSAGIQRKLLLFLQDREVRRVGARHQTRRKVDVKIVAATHMDLDKEVEEGRFRFDLYMRLRPATQIGLPPIRERADDLDGMMQHLVRRLSSDPELAPFVKDVARARGREEHIGLILDHKATLPEGLALRMPEATLGALRAHPWPGNTRELESVLDTLLLRALADARLVKTQSPILEVDHYLALKLLGMGRSRTATGRPLLTMPIEPSSDLKQMRHRLERSYLVEAFRAADGDMERMTELVLGSDHPDDRHRLTVRMNQLGLKVTELKLST